MSARWSAWIVWAALAASAVFWVLRLGTQPAPLSAHVQTVGSDQSARGDILRLFANPEVASATPVMQASAASRMRLLGVVAGFQDDGRGWVLLSVDGKPARTVRVGSLVDGDWIVQTVTNQRVEIGPAGAPAVAVLDLPLPAAAATGQLPTADGAPVEPALAVPPPPPPARVEPSAGGMVTEAPPGAGPPVAAPPIEPPGRTPQAR